MTLRISFMELRCCLFSFAQVSIFLNRKNHDGA